MRFLTWTEADELIEVPLNDIFGRLTTYIYICGFVNILEEKETLLFENTLHTFVKSPTNVFIKGHVKPLFDKLASSQSISKVAITEHTNLPNYVGKTASLITPVILTNSKSSLAASRSLRTTVSERLFLKDEIKLICQQEGIKMKPADIAEMSVDERDRELQEDANLIGHQLLQRGEKAPVRKVAEKLASMDKWKRHMTVTNAERILKPLWKKRRN